MPQCALRCANALRLSMPPHLSANQVCTHFLSAPPYSHAVATPCSSSVEGLASSVQGLRPTLYGPGSRVQGQGPKV
eukprot:2376406-Rhodomonas_salina.1